MSDGVPLPLGGVNVAAAPAAQQLVVTVPSPSAALMQLAQGATIDATVTSDSQRAATMLVSDRLGQFPVRSGALSLLTGTGLTLQVMRAGDIVQLRIMAINGQLLQPGPPAGNPAAAAAPAGADWGHAVRLGGGATPATAGGPVAAGMTAWSGNQGTIGLAAVVVGQAETGASAAPLPTGTRLLVRIAAIELPPPTATGSVPAGQASAIAVATGAGPATVLAAAAGDPAAATQVLRGSALYAAVQGTAPPPQPNIPTPGAPAAAPGGPTLLTGTVAPNTLGSQPVVQTPAGLVALATRAELPPGAAVTFEILHRAPPLPPGTAPAPAWTGPTPATAAPAWQALNDALTTLQRLDPVAAQQFAQTIPALNGRLAANMAAMVGEMRRGDGRSWPGPDVLKALERTGGRGADLARRLSGEAGEAATTVPDGGRQGGGDWRVMTLPLLTGAEIDRITLSLHRPPPEDEDEGGGETRKGDPGTRFLVDFQLTALGPVQLDGLVAKRERRFDLIMRTDTALPDDVRHEVRGIFLNAVSAMNLAGTIAFQVAAPFVVPTAPAEADKGRPGSLFGVTA